jgi:hypothetical protein
VDAQLDVLGKLLVELLETILVLADFVNKFETLLDEVLPDDLQDLVLLEHFTGDVEGKIFRIDDSLEEVEVLWDQLFAVIHDEDTPDVKLDVVLLLLVLKEIEGGALGHEEESTEFELTLNREVLDSQMLLPVVGERLVELSIFFLGDIVGVTSPDGLGLVQLFIFGVGLLLENKMKLS